MKKLSRKRVKTLNTIIQKGYLCDWDSRFRDYCASKGIMESETDEDGNTNISYESCDPLEDVLAQKLNLDPELATLLAEAWENTKPYGWYEDTPGVEVRELQVAFENIQEHADKLQEALEAIVAFRTTGTTGL